MPPFSKKPTKKKKGKSGSKTDRYWGETPDNKTNKQKKAEQKAERANRTTPAAAPVCKKAKTEPEPQLDDNSGSDSDSDASLTTPNTATLSTLLDTVTATTGDPSFDSDDSDGDTGDSASDSESDAETSAAAPLMTADSYDDFFTGDVPVGKPKYTRRAAAATMEVYESGGKTSKAPPATLMRGLGDVMVSGSGRKFGSMVPGAVMNHLVVGGGRVAYNDTLGDKAGADCGYTKCRVLVLCPTRQVGFEFVHDMVDIIEKGGGEVDYDKYVSNYDRFVEEFSVNEEEEVDDSEKKKGSKWRGLFGANVNSDDNFKIGFRVRHDAMECGPAQKDSKKALQGYREFYGSDLIVASPVGLKMHLDGEGGDFLSSVEAVYVLGSDVCFMQNWSHVDFVLGECNKRMKDYGRFEGDISRIRECYLVEGEYKVPRRICFVGEFTNAEMTATFNNNAQSPAGAYKIKDTRNFGSVHHVPIRARHVFQRVECASFDMIQKRKLEYLKLSVVKEIVNRKENGVMFYIPSYFDFVAVRNLLLKMEVKFVAVTEYARWSEVQRGRSRFFHGEAPIMLYTSRMWFFQRVKIRGAKRIHFFAPPEYDEEYGEIASWVEGGGGVGTIFTRYEGAEMERAVGVKGWKHMRESEKSTFVFA